MISFELTPEQHAIREHIQAFARSHLVNARDLYDAKTPYAKWEDRFRSTQPLYRKAVEAGLIKAQIPVPLGGMGGALIDSAIVVEEMYAVDTSASLTILGTGLGLTPILMAYNPEQHARFLAPFLSGEGTPMASLVFSEPTGSANFAEAGGPGFGTVARLEGDEYVINGEKIWATNCSGWDDRGADIQTVLVRIEDAAHDVRSQVAIVVVTRDDIARNDTNAYQVLSHPETFGHVGVQGPHIKFTNLKVPKANLLAPPGKGADLVEQTFTASAALVGAMGVGIMRQAFEYCLTWAKTERRGGKDTMLQKQSVADFLIKIKTRLEATRGLVWRACDAFGKTKFGAELCYEAKIFGSESAVQSVTDAINVVGV